MRKYLTLLFFATVATVQAQNIEILDLGYLNGDLRTKQFEVKRNKDSHADLRLGTSGQNLIIKKDKLNKKDSTYNWTVVLDFDDRVGQFGDSLFFTTSDGLVTETIVVKYQLLKGAQDVFKSYNNEFWPFRSREQVFNLKAARQGDAMAAIFDLYNFSGETLDLEGAYLSDSIAIQFDPIEVPHHTFTTAQITFQSSDTSQLGFNRTSVPLVVEEDTIGYLPIQYSILPGKGAKQDNVMVNRKNFDFKVVKQGQKKTEVTFLSNNGDSPITILKVESNCECLAYELSGYVIQPGENVQLRVDFDSTDRLGLEQKTVSVFLDSADQPVINFTFKAHVKQ